MRLHAPVASGTALAALLLRPAAANCYYPDGSSANDEPCSDSTAESTCCGIGYACYGLSAQYYLCVATGDEVQKDNATEFVRGSCTDETWRSASCPGVCIEDGRDNTSGGNGLGQCPDSTTEYYCVSPGLGLDNCSSGYNIIDFAEEPTYLTTIGVAASTSSSPVSSATSALSAFITITSSSSTASTASTASTTSTSTDSTSSATLTAASSGLSSAGKIGVGVGVGVGSVVVATIAYLAFRTYRKKKRDGLAAAAVAGVGPSGPGNTPYAAVAQVPPGYDGSDATAFGANHMSGIYGQQSYQAAKEASTASPPPVVSEMPAQAFVQHELA